MKYISVCSGIEAATCAWHPLGWEPFAFAEIEKFPSKVLAHHYPQVPNFGDMTKFEEWPDATIDLLVGGTPCQSFSVAGLRKGLADPRGNLMLTYGAIARRYWPKWLVWENVPGVLSSNGGRDFGTFLGMLGQLGYGFAYRVLDAQYFGVAQRRRRVFVVGCLGDWRGAAAVLFERHSLQGNPAPSREAGKGVAPCLDVRAGRSGETTFHTSGGLVQSVAHSLRGEGFDASEDGTGRGTPLVPVPHAHISPAIKARDSKGVSSDGDGDGAILVPMRAALPFDTTQITSAANYSNPKAGDPCHPLAAGAHVPAIAFPGRMSGTQCASSEEVSTSIGAANPTAVAYTTKLHNTQSNNAGKIFEERTTCLDSNSPPPALLTSTQVRRLTPEECEALQGFERGYTLLPGNKADGPRYKALGNSMAVPVMAWIGRRIEQVESIQEATEIAA